MAPTLRVQKPVVYQRDVQGEKHLLAGSYMLLAVESATTHSASVVPLSRTTAQVAFQVAAYDQSRPLIIDPVLSWATYLGGSGFEAGTGIAVDATGNASVNGFNKSSNFPGTTGSAQSTYGGNTDVFVAKITEGSSIISFAAIGPKAEIHVLDQAFELKATFTLGSGNNGIAPLMEPVVVHVGTFSTTIPAGSFKQYKGRFVFEGTINGVHLEAVLRSLILGNDYGLTLEGHGVDVTGVTNSVTVSLTIGNDSGSKSITAEVK